MTTILSRKLLSSQKEKYILVEREDQVYIRVGDEYLPKSYFLVPEVVDILGIRDQRGRKDRNRVHRMCKVMGIQARANRRKKLRITLQQLRQMAKMI